MLPQLLLLKGIFFCKEKNTNSCYHIKLPDKELSAFVASLLSLTLFLLKEFFEVCSISVYFTPSVYMLMFTIYIGIWYAQYIGYPMLPR